MNVRYTYTLQSTPTNPVKTTLSVLSQAKVFAQRRLNGTLLDDAAHTITHNICGLDYFVSKKRCCTVYVRTVHVYCVRNQNEEYLWMFNGRCLLRSPLISTATTMTCSRAYSFCKLNLDKKYTRWDYSWISFCCKKICTTQTAALEEMRNAFFIFNLLLVHFKCQIAENDLVAKTYAYSIAFDGINDCETKQFHRWCGLRNGLDSKICFALSIRWPTSSNNIKTNLLENVLS